MEILSNSHTYSMEKNKIKIQGFLYTYRESIFKNHTIPESSTNYTKNDFLVLEKLLTLYEDLFENSIGVLTSSHVKLNDKKCVACQRCTKFCSFGALEKIGVDLILHESKCISCGNCVGACPFLALNASETGLGVYIRNLTCHKPYILPILYNSDELENLFGKIYNFFENNRSSKENLSEVIERMGFDIFLQYIN